MIMQAQLWNTLRCCFVFGILHREVLTVRATSKFVSLQLILSTIDMCVVIQDFTVSLQPDSEYVHVCPGDSVEVNCTSTTSFLRWKLSVTHENICEIQDFTPTSSEHYQLYGFSLTLVSSSNGRLISSSRLEDVGLNISGSILTCSSSIAELPQANEMISITILVEGNSGCKKTCVQFH